MEEVKSVHLYFVTHAIVATLERRVDTANLSSPGQLWSTNPLWHPAFSIHVSTPSHGNQTFLHPLLMVIPHTHLQISVDLNPDNTYLFCDLSGELPCPSGHFLFPGDSRLTSFLQKTPFSPPLSDFIKLAILTPSCGICVFSGFSLNQSSHWRSWLKTSNLPSRLVSKPWISDFLLFTMLVHDVSLLWLLLKLFSVRLRLDHPCTNSALLVTLTLPDPLSSV